MRRCLHLKHHPVDALVRFKEKMAFLIFYFLNFKSQRERNVETQDDATEKTTTTEHSLLKFR